ncbi:hypothetical protein [Paraburkholderia lacunae]|uniref:Uncharacterized protein n=1 Tax=Paraburkholderia lacunae TaxID=2211104 RepID=A0A370NAY9_9BURK|nr:hypothetical protein [Paraburkholderia lacunae]RDK02754.1 hypothetical protein DLM46_10910 [Paraburkholderia lacunae]
MAEASLCTKADTSWIEFVIKSISIPIYPDKYSAIDPSDRQSEWTDRFVRALMSTTADSPWESPHDGAIA